MASRAKKQKTQAAMNLQASIDLKTELEALIKPHVDKDKSPPFSLTELAVIAWVCGEHESNVISEREIFTWLVITFRYYALVALESSKPFEGPGSRPGPSGHIRDLAASLSDSMVNVEVPMQRVTKAIYSERSTAYTTSLASSRAFLRRILKPGPKRFARFLDLPTEVRLAIYEEALYFPGALEYVDRRFNADSKPRAFDVLWSEERAAKGAAALDGRILLFSPWVLEHDRRVTAASTTILALLLVNKQIFTEAVPIFYNINTFACDIYALPRMLRHCGERRRSYFSRLQISVSGYHGASKAFTKQAFAMLAEVKQLKDVEISTKDTSFPVEVTSEKEHSLPHRMCWVNSLIELKTRSLHFTGSPRIEAYVQGRRALKIGDESEVASAKKQAAKSRKRKAPKSAAFCTVDDNVPTKKQTTAASRAKKIATARKITGRV